MPASNYTFRYVRSSELADIIRLTVHCSWNISVLLGHFRSMFCAVFPKTVWPRHYSCQATLAASHLGEFLRSWLPLAFLGLVGYQPHHLLTLDRAAWLINGFLCFATCPWSTIKDDGGCGYIPWASYIVCIYNSWIVRLIFIGDGFTWHAP